MSDSEVERRRLITELERLIGCVQTLPPSNPGYERFPYMRANAHWKEIALVTKEAAEWLSIAGKPNAFASKPWLQLQLTGDSRRAREWPIDDLVRDLRFVQKVLLATAPGSLQSASASEKLSSGELARKPRRSPRYEAIDKALREFAEARPESHQEVFRLLEDRRVATPNRRPFKPAGGWLKGYQQDRHAASVWLSQAWRRLGLPPFARGPQK